MDTIGLDLHQRESQLCICDEDGTITERGIVTSRERFTPVLGDRPRTKILLEASTERPEMLIAVGVGIIEIAPVGRNNDAPNITTVVAQSIGMILKGLESVISQRETADGHKATLTISLPLGMRLAPAREVGTGIQSGG